MQYFLVLLACESVDQSTSYATLSVIIRFDKSVMIYSV